MKIFLRALVGLLLLLALLLVGLPSLAFPGAGAMTDSPAVAGVLSLLVLVGLCLPVMLWISRRMPGGKRPRTAALVLAVYLLAIGTLAFLVFLRPLPGIEVAIPIAPTGYWDLPTGSKIAYLHVPARGQRRATPMIRVHGGPAIPDYEIEYDGRLRLLAGFRRVRAAPESARGPDHQLGAGEWLKAQVAQDYVQAFTNSTYASTFQTRSERLDLPAQSDSQCRGWC